MSRADEIRQRMESEIALAEAEDALIKAKAAKTNPQKLAEIKNDLRSKRQAHRSGREGEGTANPAPVNASAVVKRKG